jgi:hypothetical protein
MKEFQSIIEGTWIELLNVELTEEQTILLLSSDEEPKLDLVNYIKSQREGVVEPNKLNTLISLYNTIKPILKDGDVYQLISINLSEIAEDVFTGILNFRISGDHRQIRF